MMRCRGLYLLYTLSWILVMNTLCVTSKCGAGTRNNNNRCVPCEKGKFRNEGHSLDDHCRVCSICGYGTKEKSPCTVVSDTECECLEGFTRRPKNKNTCDCGKGSGVDSTGKRCLTCEDGFLSVKTDGIMKCQKWKDCGSLGVKFKGSASSDVTCATATEVTDTGVPSSSPSLTTKTVIPATIMATATSMNQYSIHTQEITSLSVPSFVSRQSMTTSAPSASAEHYYSGMVALLFTAFILLIICFALIFKLAAGLCLKQLKKPIARADTVCRRPVEESGDKSCSSLVSSTESSHMLEDV
ncbi:tumor necrosis factor receptor superfamily member 10C [Alosa sapidissima]|uniref:tumor necrosis factor receptor superfamily member 10C n=1 Tax=Alosa sapidissima TaxID=34773 RepID=UPI001C088258|nr:tumor necrosis factor receptor superfamily member 10C [Alosa sapidissima]